MAMQLTGMPDPVDLTPTHPGGVATEGERSVGWRLGVAAAWSAIRNIPDQSPAIECRKRIEALGNAGPAASV